jgi:hypothetical protein
VNNFINLIQALYAISVRFYPREYRLEFEHELLSVFGALAQDAASRGPVALVVFCLRELRDYPISLLQTHLEKNRMSAFFRSAPVNFTLRGVLAFVALFVAYQVVAGPVNVQMQNFGLSFFGMYVGGDDLRTYANTAYNFFVVLLAWFVSAVIGATLFATIFAERARLRWFILVAVMALLPWFIPYVIFQAISGGEKELAVPHLGRYFIGAEENLLWVGVMIAALLAIGVIAILLAALFQEQAGFRRFVLMGLAAWLPLLIGDEIFALIQPASEVDIQGMLSNALLGACLAGMLGLLLLKDRRKLPWLIAAGLVLYPVAEYLLYDFIYGWLVAPLFNQSVFTLEQMTLQSGLLAAIRGLIFGLPLALIFVWLANGHFRQLRGKEVKDPA